ncbi:hypothetical protein NQS42_18440 [Bacillus sp. C10(2022)]
MYRKSFADYKGKKGHVGSMVTEVNRWTGEPTGERKKVEQILSRGAAGTWIYFDKGPGGKGSNYLIVDDEA